MSKYKYLLEFSGGRDSLAVLKLWEDKKDETLVIWVHTGAVLPELEKRVFTALEGWDFTIERTDADSWIRDHGFPVDLVPTWRTPLGAQIAGNERLAKFADALSCCYANIMRPMHVFALMSGIPNIVRGQRNAEKLKSTLRSGHSENGVTLLFPLEDWSDEEVDTFLREQGVELPEWYQYGSKGMDCWFCTGYVKESKGLHRYLQLRHPEKFSLLKQRFKEYEEAVMNEMCFLEE